MFQSNAAVAQVILQRPSTLPVLERHGLTTQEHRCSSLAKAASAASIDVADLLDELNNCAEPKSGNIQLAHAPQGQENLQLDFHAPILIAFSSLESDCTRILRAHGSDNPKMRLLQLTLQRFALLFREHAATIDSCSHSTKQSDNLKDNLFTNFTTNNKTLLRKQLDSLTDCIQEMRSFTDDYDIPRWATATLRDFLQRLHELDRRTSRCVKLEIAML